MRAKMGLRMFWTILILISLISLHSAEGLQCYKCTNIEVEDDSSGVFKALASRSDPQCAFMPNSPVTCAPDMNACGSLNGYLSVNTFLGTAKAKLQVRDCMKDDGSEFAQCRTNDIGNKLVSDILNLFILDSNTHSEVKGEVCTCKLDLCLACNGGFEIAGKCIKYWMLGLLAGSVLLLLGLSVTCCCCCCCGCCRKGGRRGQVFSTSPSYQILTVTPANSNGALSIQSGDLRGFENPAANVNPPAGSQSVTYSVSDPVVKGANSANPTLVIMA